MIELEAIEELKYDCGQLGKSIPSDTSWGQSMNAAYGMAIAALEKQISKKPIKSARRDKIEEYNKTFEIFGVPYELCPNCLKNLPVEGIFEVKKEGMRYCENCGQALDWND